MADLENNSYLIRLLQEAREYFRDKPVCPELQECDAELVRHLSTLSSAELPPSPSTLKRLKQELIKSPKFQELLAIAINYPPSKWLLEQEQPYLEARRKLHGIEATTPDTKPYEWADENMVQGICLSGGGIRSATFNLGVLQGLAHLDLLKSFDYLSSVSGGGYIHQFLAAWTKREEARSKDHDKEYSTGDGFRGVVRKLDPLPNEHGAIFHPEPIKWLRRYSNYLTPAKGIGSADMWVAVAVWLRNAFLNQIVLLSGLFMLVLLARLVAYLLRYPLPPVLPKAVVVVCFSVTTVYLGLALYREYARTRKQDLREASRREGRRGSSEWVDRAFHRMSKRPSIAHLQRRVLRFDWIGGDAAALRLGVAPFLIAAFVSVAPLVLPDPAPPVWPVAGMVFACLAVVALVTVFAGGAWREYASLMDEGLTRLTRGGIWLCCYSALLASLLGTLSFVGFWQLLRLGSASSTLIAVFGPPVLLQVPFLTQVFGAGLVGRDFPDWMREWLARLRAWALMLGLSWIAVFGIVLLGPWLVHALVESSAPWISTLKWSSVLGWVATTAGSLLAGTSARTSGRTNQTNRSSPLEILALVGPHVYVLGLLILLSWAADQLIGSPGSGNGLAAIETFVVSAALFLIFGFRVDINVFSLNNFYRNRLTRCYLGASNTHREPSPLTGFDDNDTRGMQISRLLPVTPPVMEKVKKAEDEDFVPYTGPFPIICTTLNLTFGEDLAWQDRKAASFAFTPLYSGYTVGWTAGKRGEELSFNGFVPTFNYAFPDGGINIAVAVAVSGAAASPNWGYHTNPATAFLMTMFDVRLGWWICNPRRLTDLAGAGLLVKDHPTDRSSPRFAPWQLTKELLGMTGDNSNYVYLSDGGHFDNMGLYELVRRRCHRILICDAEEDGNYVFEGLGMAIRRCRIDFGVEITLGDLKEIRVEQGSELSHAHFACGTIRYPERVGSSKTVSEGQILYLKSSLTGARRFVTRSGSERQLATEPADILNYKLQHDAFPHDTTADQWFTESQFESYRRLGAHVIEEMDACGLWDAFKREGRAEDGTPMGRRTG